VSTSDTWFVDTSVLLAAMVGSSPSAKAWFDAGFARGDTFLGSRLLEVETKRFILNKELAGELSPGQVVPERYLDRFGLLVVDDDLLREAIAIRHPLRRADAIHVAAALRVGPDEVTVVTHDAQMVRACHALGFEVYDPVMTPGTADPEDSHDVEVDVRG